MQKISKLLIILGLAGGWAGIYVTYFRNQSWGEAVFIGSIVLLAINHISIKHARDSDQPGSKKSLILSYIAFLSFIIAGIVGSFYYGLWTFLFKK
jgi:uncharacterized membrane protein YfcA